MIDGHAAHAGETGGRRNIHIRQAVYRAYGAGSRHGRYAAPPRLQGDRPQQEPAVSIEHRALLAIVGQRNGGTVRGDLAVGRRTGARCFYGGVIAVDMRLRRREYVRAGSARQKNIHGERVISLNQCLGCGQQQRRLCFRVGQCRDRQQAHQRRRQQRRENTLQLHFVVPFLFTISSTAQAMTTAAKATHNAVCVSPAGVSWASLSAAAVSVLAAASVSPVPAPSDVSSSGS